MHNNLFSNSLFLIFTIFLTTQACSQTIDTLTFLIDKIPRNSDTTIRSSLRPYEKTPGFGEITEEAFNTKKYAAFSETEVVRILDYGYYALKENNIYELTRHIQLHVLKPGGLKVADQVIEYVSFKKLEKITDVRGQTINLENGQIRKFPIQKENIFIEEDKNGFGRVRFSFSKAQVGSILEFTYIINSRQTSAPRTWYFQSNYPALLSRYKVNVGFANNYHSQIKGKMQVLRTIDKEDNKEWFLKNVPAIQKEPYMSSLDNFAQQTSFYPIHKYTVRGRLMGLMLERVLQKDRNDWAYFNEKFWKETKLTKKIEIDKSLKKISWETTKNAQNDLEKIERIYEQILNKLVWNKRYSSIPNNSSTKTYTNREGNSAEINCVLISMLNAVGIKAKPLLVSTREHGRIDIDNARVGQFNHIICYVELGDRLILLNAIDPLRPYTLLAQNDLNRMGWLLDEQEGKWVVFPENYSASSHCIARMEFKENGKLKGSIRKLHSGYAALEIRKDWKYTEEQKAKPFVNELWGHNLIDGKLNKEKIDSLANINASVEIAAIYEGNDFSSINQELIYINPMLWFDLASNPFQAEARKYPIDFGHRIEEKYSFSLKIPENFDLKSLPKSLIAQTEKGGIIYSYQVRENNGIIHLEIELKVRQLLFPSIAYSTLKKIFEQIRLKEGQQIVLIKQ